MKVLVVEDEPINRTIIRRLLAKRFPFCQVSDAKNGIEAIALVEKEEPDVMLLDLRLPLMNGLEVLEVLRKSPRHSALPVVVVSAIQDKTVVLNLMRMGIEGYILKPLDIDSASQKLHKIFGDIRTKQVQARHGVGNELTRNPSILLIDKDLTFRTFFASVLQNGGELVYAEDGARAVRSYTERLSTVVCISESVNEGVGLLSDKFLAKKIREIDKQAGTKILLCTDRMRLKPEESTYFHGVLRKTYVKRQFFESLMTQVFETEGVMPQIRYLIRFHVISGLMSGLKHVFGAKLGSPITVLDPDVEIPNWEHAVTTELIIPSERIGLNLSISSSREAFEQHRRDIAETAELDMDSSSNIKVFRPALLAVLERLTATLTTFGYLDSNAKSEPAVNEVSGFLESPPFTLPFVLSSGLKFYINFTPFEFVETVL